MQPCCTFYNKLNPEILNTMHSLKKQEGGSHYKNFKIQPVEFIQKNKLGYCEGNIIKYATRHKVKNGVEDLKKVIHYAEMLIAFEYGDPLDLVQIPIDPAMAANMKERERVRKEIADSIKTPVNVFPLAPGTEAAENMREDSVKPPIWPSPVALQTLDAYIKSEIGGSNLDTIIPNLVLKNIRATFVWNREKYFKLSKRVTLDRDELESLRKQVDELKYSSVCWQDEAEKVKRTNAQLTETNLQYTAENMELAKRMREPNAQLTEANLQYAAENIELTKKVAELEGKIHNQKTVSASVKTIVDHREKRSQARIEQLELENARLKSATGISESRSQNNRLKSEIKRLNCLSHDLGAERDEVQLRNENLEREILLLKGCHADTLKRLNIKMNFAGVDHGISDCVGRNAELAGQLSEARDTIKSRGKTIVELELRNEGLESELCTFKARNKRQISSMCNHTQELNQQQITIWGFEKEVENIRKMIGAEKSALYDLTQNLNNQIIELQKEKNNEQARNATKSSEHRDTETGTTESNRGEASSSAQRSGDGGEGSSDPIGHCDAAESSPDGGRAECSSEHEPSADH